MKKGSLFLLVEGPDDERFIDGVFLDLLKIRYRNVKCWKYAEKAARDVSRFLRALTSMKADYVLLTDINNAPCVTARKTQLEKKIHGLARDRIIVVIREIEGWYLAGLGAADARNLKVPVPRNTDNLTKESFDTTCSKAFDSRLDFMQEILKCYSLDAAGRKNLSLRYFSRKAKSGF